MSLLRKLLPLSLLPLTVSLPLRWTLRQLRPLALLQVTLITILSAVALLLSCPLAVRKREGGGEEGKDGEEGEEDGVGGGVAERREVGGGSMEAGERRETRGV